MMKSQFMVIREEMRKIADNLEIHTIMQNQQQIELNTLFQNSYILIVTIYYCTSLLVLQE